jgi:hypothetical protein
MMRMIAIYRVAVFSGVAPEKFCWFVCFAEMDFVEIHTSNTKPTPANSVQQHIVQRQSKAIAFPSRFLTSSFLFERIGAYPPSGPK